MNGRRSRGRNLRLALRDVAVERPRDVAEDLVPFPGEECREVAAERAARREVEQAMTGAADLDHHAAVVGDDPGLGVGDGCSGIEEPPDDLHETVGRDRLDQIGVGAAGEAVLPSLGGRIGRGDHHDGQRGTRGLDLLADAEAVAVGQAQVEQHEPERRRRSPYARRRRR